MSSRSFRIIAFSMLGSLVALNAAAFLARFDFVVRSEAMAATTAFEDISLYNIWKNLHGFPLYEWPQKGTMLLTAYNAGFYGIYALWARLWGASGPELVLCVRLLTLLGALGGMLVNVALLRRFVAGGRGVQAWIWSLSFLVWFGTAFAGWNTLTARPDLGAAALALGGLAIALRAGDEERRDLMLAASALFFVAWSLQASAIWIFVGTVLHVCFRDRRRWPTILALIGPCGGAAALMIALGGEAYRYNLFVAPWIFRWLPLQGLRLLATTIGVNVFFWATAVWAAVRCLRDVPDLQPGERTLAFIAAPSVAAGMVLLARHGADTTALAEGFVMASLVGSVAWLRAWETTATRRLRLAGLALAMAMIPLPLVQTIQAARGKTYATVKGVSVGNLIKLTPAQIARRREFADWMQTLPHPLWISDGMLELPWFSSDNRYPAFPRNFQFESDARRRGVWAPHGFSGWVQRKYFAGLLLRPSDGLRQAARRAGYVEAAVPERFRPLLATAYGVEETSPRLWLRKAQGQPAGTPRLPAPR